MTEKITYKDPRYVLTWLDTALKKEWQKYTATPVTPDMIPGYDIAQAWGYVVAGYFLIEQGLKAVLYMRGGEPPKIHALSGLFTKLSAEDQNVLREYYDDFRHAFPGISSFPLTTLDGFLKNLDGGRNNQGRHIGSFDWRYFPTEEGKGASMPLVSINVMHEIVYGCVNLIKSIHKGDNKAAEGIYSWRLWWSRSEFHEDWLTVRVNSSGWGKERDRIEILWGPDYNGRHDYLVFKGDKLQSFFGPLPKANEVELPMIDKRSELESFDPVEGFRSIGVSFPERRQKPETRHIMY